MVFGIPINFRGMVITSILGSLVAIFLIIQNSKQKEDYPSTIGTIEYLDLTYQDLPYRDLGSFRYLKVSSYPSVFEIFEPNSLPSSYTIDSLKVGDSVQVYYYETFETKNIGLNKFVQYIDRGNQAVFIRNSFQKNLGFVLLGLSLAIGIAGIYLLSKNR